MWPEVSVPLFLELEFTCRGQRSGGLPPPLFFFCNRMFKTAIMSVPANTCVWARGGRVFGGVVVEISVSDVDY